MAFRSTPSLCCLNCPILKFKNLLKLKYWSLAPCSGFRISLDCSCNLDAFDLLVASFWFIQASYFRKSALSLMLCCWKWLLGTRNWDDWSRIGAKRAPGGAAATGAGPWAWALACSAALAAAAASCSAFFLASSAACFAFFSSSSFWSLSASYLYFSRRSASNFAYLASSSSFNFLILYLSASSALAIASNLNISYLALSASILLLFSIWSSWISLSISFCVRFLSDLS